MYQASTQRDIVLCLGHLTEWKTFYCFLRITPPRMLLHGTTRLNQLSTHLIGTAVSQLICHEDMYDVKCCPLSTVAFLVDRMQQPRSQSTFLVAPIAPRPLLSK